MAAEQSLAIIFQKAVKSRSGIPDLLIVGREKGFQNFVNRKLIWPFLLELDLVNLNDSSFEWKERMDHSSSDFEQLQKDAERSLASMKTFQTITKFHLRKRQQAVLSVLDSFFAKNKDLKYIQGFHDVASIFLILFGDSAGYYMMEKAGRVYFFDFLTYDVGQIGRIMSSLIFDLVISEDEDFKTIFQCYKESKMLIFLIPWVLTWFAHVFSSVKTICRIWDYILCTGPNGVIYLAAGIILSTKSQLVATYQEFDEASIHTFYQQKAKNQSIDIEASIKIALDLQSKILIADLPGYKEFQQLSIFRLPNFEKHITIHQQLRKKRLRDEQNRKRLKNVLITGALTVGAVAALFAFNKYVKPISFLKLGGQM